MTDQQLIAKNNVFAKLAQGGKLTNMDRAKWIATERAMAKRGMIYATTMSFANPGHTVAGNPL